MKPRDVACSVRQQPDSSRQSNLGKHANELDTAGKVNISYALKPAFTATTIKVRNGQTLIKDGPYSATPEQIEYCHIIEALHLDQALDWAAEHPAVLSGEMEVRPLDSIHTSRE